MDIILKPIVTEKMTEQGETLNCYGFEVQRNANKLEIKKAVEALYDVTVVDVNTMIVTPKKKSRYTQSGAVVGKTASYKKAIVTLEEGDTIDFFSNI